MLQKIRVSKFLLTTCLKRSIHLPAIVSDIDGVIYRGGHEISQSKKVLDNLINTSIPLSSDGKSRNFKIPFVLLTNGGGVPE